MKIGEIDISKVMVGSDEIAAIYAGLDLVYSGGTTPPTPTFQGKWLATYQGGTTSSAECGSSSEITEGEITLSDLVSVEIGDCVTSIGNNAFQFCDILQSVTMPDSITSIGEEVFVGCSSLQSVTMPDYITSIGNRAFQDCGILQSVTIPDSITSIGEEAFIGCDSLQSVTILSFNPYGVSLGTDAFDYTNNCPIYVPASSLSAYQSASGWSNYSSRLQSIPL